MFARGEFRNDAAVFGMEFDLGGYDAGQDFSVTNHRHAGFITGSFDGENGHGNFKFSIANVESSSWHAPLIRNLKFKNSKLLRGNFSRPRKLAV